MKLVYMKLILIIAAILILATGCQQAPVYEVDRDKQHRMMIECIEAATAGPNRSTHHRDQTGVVGQCRSASYYTARKCVARCPGGTPTTNE
jgi:hypothetical protein